MSTSLLSVHPGLPRYLFYVDDIMIFLHASRANGRNIHQLLVDYGRLSGQVYRPSKSRIYYSTKSDTRFKTYVCCCSSIATGELLFSYLGVSDF